MRASVAHGVRVVGGMLGTVALWGALHKFAAHAYGELCVPHSWVTALWSPVVVSTPHCMALRWCIAHAASSVTVGTAALVSTLLAAPSLSPHPPGRGPRQTLKGRPPGG